MINYILHEANTRGHANHGWLNAFHSFSFANWRNPDRDNFGVLRVLNDDTVAAGMGFGTHGHDNMEIITIPLEGDLAHKDSMGNAETIRTGDIQVMSAGTGIKHSEFNPNKNLQTKLLQIWLFPKQRNVLPRYQQISLNPLDSKNKLQQILSPNPDDEGVWIHQDAWFHLGDFDSEVSTTYIRKKAGNGLYIFIISGSINVDNQTLNEKDGLGITDFETIDINAITNSKFLLMEIPMTI